MTALPSTRLHNKSNTNNTVSATIHNYLNVAEYSYIPVGVKVNDGTVETVKRGGGWLKK